jgi:hypothetical protein
MAAKSAPATEVQLTLKKSTKGTHVYANEEHGLSLYFPKTLSVFQGKEDGPATLTLTLK